MIKIKRVYEKQGKDDGIRVLVDRLWPRGLSKESARIDMWFKDIAPSNNLRKWFAHREERWNEFKQTYLKELILKKNITHIGILKELGAKNKLTLLYGAKDQEKNNAVILREFLKKLSQGPDRRRCEGI